MHINGALKICDWGSTSVETEAIFWCRMYFLHGWVDAICPAVMYMFDVDDNKILSFH